MGVPAFDRRSGFVSMSHRGRHRRGIVRLFGLLFLLSLFVLAVWISFWQPARLEETPATVGTAVQGEIATGQKSPLASSKGEPVPGGEPDDPSKDGWQTEVFAEIAKHRLEELIRLAVEDPATIAAECQQLVTKDFRGQSILPEQIERVYQDGTIVVERPRKILPQDRGVRETESPRPAVRSVEDFIASVQRWAEAFRQASDLRFEVKVIAVHLDGQRATTTQRIAVTARTETGRIEQHATWIADWKLQSDKESPLLTGLRVEGFEQSIVSHREGELLADCTASVLAENPCFTSQILQGYATQLQRTQDWRYCVLLGQTGLAVGDVNGDALEDLYVSQESGLPNLLLIQQPDGTAKNLAREWGVDWLYNSPAALLVDLDNDGDQDLAVAVAGGIIISSNEGDHFEERTFLPTADDTRSLSAADYDLDGRLDLFLCVYEQDGDLTDRESAIPGISYRDSLYHDATSGGPNALFRNQGDWQFQDVADQVGLGRDNHRLSWAASWEDFDNDGDLDLYVANDYAANSLYRNEPEKSTSQTADATKRKFVDVAQSMGAGDHANGMSVSWADHNRDGWMDIYVGNMFSSAGNRITTQAAFKADASEEVRSTLKRFARGNTLLRNRGDGTFEDRSEQAGVTLGRWAWSSPFADINNDGWEDVLVANGFITGRDARDL
jgi:hypothetical protein